MQNLQNEQEKAILVGVCLQKEDNDQKKLSLNELERLAETAGIITADKFIQNRNRIDKTYFTGKGFIENVVNEMMKANAEVLIFDNELSPSQARNIEKDFNVNVIDRTEVILDIFHQHARSKEAKLQVKLAELQYQLPRLKKLWSHLDKERGAASGSSGAARGMGEKQIEIDKRQVRLRMKKVVDDLRKIDKQRSTQRKRRKNMKKVCLIGYTNAGKSTLFNRISGADVIVQDKLFATLESTARAIEMEKGRDILLSDTVGFISDLPHNLVASFRATLKDVQDADLLLHAVDSADPNFKQYIKEVRKVLKQIDSDNIPQILVLNKIDLLEGQDFGMTLSADESSISISAKTGKNIDLLLQKVDEILYKAKEYELIIPHTDQKIINRLHELAKITKKEYHGKGVKFIAEINQEDLRFFRDYLK